MKTDPGDGARDPRTDPQPGDLLTDGRIHIRIDFVRDDQVYYARFREPLTDDSFALDLNRIPMDAYRTGAASARVKRTGRTVETVPLALSADDTDALYTPRRGG